MLKYENWLSLNPLIFLYLFFQGYGFVHFETEEAALSAIQKVNGMLLNGKKVFVGRFVPRKDREIELGEKAKMFTNVFIKNLSEDVEEGALLEMFEAFGKITSLKVMKGTCIDLIYWLNSNELGTHRNYMVIDLGINNSGIHTVQELLRQF